MAGSGNSRTVERVRSLPHPSLSSLKGSGRSGLPPRGRRLETLKRWNSLAGNEICLRRAQGATEPWNDLVLALLPEAVEDATRAGAPGWRVDVTSVWPDVSAATSPHMKVRDQLDYVVWVTSALEPLGFHEGAELEVWRTRVHRAYLALVDSMTPGHGDPLPPDVPPSVRPGLWPDGAAGGIPGMTVRHQLAVLRAIATATRTTRAFPHAPADVTTWAGRVQTAYDALDHGAALTIPAEARTLPPPPLPGAPKRRSGGKSGSGAGHTAAKKSAKAARPKRVPLARATKPSPKGSPRAKRAGGKKG